MPKRKAPAAAEIGEDEPLDQPEGSDAEPTDGDDDNSTSEGDDDGGSSADGTSEDDEDGAAFDSVDVDFELFSPQEKDFHGLKALLQAYLDGRQYGCSELVDALIASPCATVIKCGEDDDPIGVTGVLNLRTHGALKCLAQLKAFLLEHCAGAGVKKALEAAWAAPATGLIVSERLMNCPPQLAPPLMRALFGEIEAARTAEATREEFAFDRYILLARVYVDPQAPEQPKQAPTDKKAKKEGGRAAAAELIHATPEGEFLSKHAAWQHSFPVPHRPVGKDDLTPHRLVAVVDAAAVPAAMAELNTVIPV